MNDTASTVAAPRRRRKLCVALLLAVPFVCWVGEIGRQQLALSRAQGLGLEPRYRHAVVESLSFAPASPFTDADWDAIRPFADIEGLDLTFTQATGRVLDRLDDFPRLRTLRVLVSQITPQQERRLLRDRPRLYIEKLHLIDGLRVRDGFQ